VLARVSRTATVLVRARARERGGLRRLSPARASRRPRELARRLAPGASPPSPAVAAIALALVGAVGYTNVYLPYFSRAAAERRGALADGAAAPNAKTAPGSYWRAVTAARDGAAGSAPGAPGKEAGGGGGGHGGR